MTTLLLLAALTCTTTSAPSIHQDLPPSLSRMESIGSSRDGRPIELVTLANPISDADRRPAVLVIAGLDGERPLGTTLARGIARRLVDDHPELLDDTTFYIIPLANPDGAMTTGRHGTSRPLDQDRDGRFDEDPPRDLDGNGLITMMRRANPPLDDPPTHLPDPAEPRLLKTPDHDAGEHATHSLHIEGVDADGDGLIAEDGPEGVDLDHNFMHRWPEYGLDSGPYQLSEVEARAIADFVIGHPNLVAAIVYGRHDNLIHAPDSTAMDITGRTPKELAGDDAGNHTRIAERYRELVGQTRAPREDSAGSLHAWLYAHRGIPTFASTGWGRPDLPEPESTEPEESTSASEPEAALEPADKDAAEWLAYSDQVRDGAGFVPWTPYDHPQLGPVEIGGWVPRFRSEPPDALVDDLIERHAGWIAELATERPRLEIIGPEVDPLGGGLARLRLGIRNDGGRSTRTHQATRTRVRRPTNIRLLVGEERLIEGENLVQIELIRPGELRVLEWTIRITPDEIVSLEIDDPVLATQITHDVEVSP